MSVRARRFGHRVARTVRRVPEYAYGILAAPLALRGQQRSWKRLRADAQRLGLEARDAGETTFGVLAGTVSGRTVVVNPEREGLLAVLFRRERALCFSTRAKEKSSGLDPYVDDTPDFNAAFETRRADEATARAWKGDPRLTAAVLEHYLRWLPEIAHFTIRDFGIACHLARNAFYPALRATDIEPLLPGLLELAERIESSLPAGDDVNDEFYRGAFTT